MAVLRKPNRTTGGPPATRDFGTEDGGDDPMVMDDERDLKPSTGRGRIQTGTIRDPIISGDTVDYASPGPVTTPSPVASTNPVDFSLQERLRLQERQADRRRRAEAQAMAVQRALMQRGVPRQVAKQIARPAINFFRALSALKSSPTRARYETAKSAYISLIKAAQS